MMPSPRPRHSGGDERTDQQQNRQEPRHDGRNVSVLPGDQVPPCRESRLGQGATDALNATDLGDR
jgi:hypothetical protein